MTQARTAGGHAMGAARPLRGAPRHAAYAAGQAAVVAHVAAHELGAAAYAIKAVQQRPPAMPSLPDGSNASGSETSSRRTSGSWCSTTSASGTTSAGRSSTADPPRSSVVAASGLPGHRGWFADDVAQVGVGGESQPRAVEPDAGGTGRIPVDGRLGRRQLPARPAG